MFQFCDYKIFQFSSLCHIVPAFIYVSWLIYLRNSFTSFAFLLFQEEILLWWVPLLRLKTTSFALCKLFSSSRFVSGTYTNSSSIAFIARLTLFLSKAVRFRSLSWVVWSSWVNTFFRNSISYSPLSSSHILFPSHIVYVLIHLFCFHFLP